MKNEKQINILTKTIKSMTAARAEFAAKLAEVTGKLNEAQVSFAQIMGLPAPQVLRVAGVSKFAVLAKGPNETAFNAAYGRCRLQDKTIATFNLKGTREEMIGSFAELIKNKKAIKTVTGWQAAINSPKAPAKVAAVAKPAKKAAPKAAKKSAKPAKAVKTHAKKAKVAKVATPAKKSGISAKAAALAAEAFETLPADQVAIMG